ncbi:hypothetical protein [Flavobacterium sp. UGB4466]|uniref:hypothetical protein n=1 Tax=Flavobacterium sp. UGB4466 TaxID=2730889 RepID=UPI00192BFAF3|nr:hypothetical protein [Flavobacterium sp. UGB4466]
MKNIFLFLFLFTLNQVFSQDDNYTNSEKIIVDVFGKCFKDLNQIKGTRDVIPVNKNVKFCSMYQCVSRIGYTEKAKDIEKAIIKRAIKIATRLYNEGTPVYLTCGANSSNQADWYNQNLTDDNNLVYISIAECVVSHSLITIQKAVNQETMKLIKNYKSRK